jgi:hypothetical protein
VQQGGSRHHSRAGSLTVAVPHSHLRPGRFGPAGLHWCPGLQVCLLQMSFTHPLPFPRILFALCSVSLCGHKPNPAYGPSVYPCSFANKSLLMICRTHQLPLGAMEVRIMQLRANQIVQRETTKPLLFVCRCTADKQPFTIFLRCCCTHFLYFPRILGSRCSFFERQG